MPTYQRTAQLSEIVRNADGDRVWVATGGTVETYKILGEGWKKIDDAPYYPLGTAPVVVTSPDSVAGLSKYQKVKVITDGLDVEIKANAADNPYSLSLTQNVEVELDNEFGYIDALFATGTGDVTVTGVL